MKLGSGTKSWGMMFGASSSIQQINGFSCLVGVHLDIVFFSGRRNVILQPVSKAVWFLVGEMGVV